MTDEISLLRAKYESLVMHGAALISALKGSQDIATECINENRQLRSALKSVSEALKSQEDDLATLHGDLERSTERGAKILDFLMTFCRKVELDAMDDSGSDLTGTIEDALKFIEGMR